jgi:hypothetical protein
VNLEAASNITLSLLAAGVILLFMSQSNSSQLGSTFFQTKHNLPQDPTLVDWREDAILCANNLENGPYTDPLIPTPILSRYATPHASSNSALMSDGCDYFSDVQSE